MARGSTTLIYYYYQCDIVALWRHRLIPVVKKGGIRIQEAKHASLKLRHLPKFLHPLIDLLTSNRFQPLEAE